VRLKIKILLIVLCVAGLPGQDQALAQLRAGYAKTDITPSKPVWMGGYDLRNASSDGVWDNIYVRALVFESGKTRVAFIECDLVDLEDFDGDRKRISQETGIPVDNILLGTVHNHAAPVAEAKKNPEWAKQFENSLGPTVKRAIAELRPVRIATGQGTSHIAMNRRAIVPEDRDTYSTYDENNRSQSFGEFKTDHAIKIHEFEGELRLGANPGGPTDTEVQLVRIDDEQGKPYAVMIHYPCHGTTLGGRNGKISGEWMGHMGSYVESQVPGLHAIYLQGAAGDINPRVVGGLDGDRDDIKTTYALGEEIGREVVRVYRTLTPQPLVNQQIELMTRDILLPRAYRLLAASFNDPAVHAPTTALRIGDLMWITFPGELFSSIGKDVKAALPAQDAYFMGYTNGSIGYFPTQKAFGEGGYEPSDSLLAPIAEHIYMREIRKLIRAFVAEYQSGTTE